MGELQAKANWGLCALGLTLGLGFIVSTIIFTRAFKEIKSESQTIEVSGFAQKKITSDLAIWQCAFSARAPKLADANTQLGETRKQVMAYMTKQGAKQENLELSPPSAHTIYAQDAQGRQTGVIEGYVMSQAIQFTSAEIEKVAGAAQNSSDLAGQGIEITAEAPSFLYTKLDEVKMEMLGEAAANARQRAQKLAAQSESGVGALRYVHQGVFQITPPYSNEVSDNGINDTTSKQKTIKAIVTARYAVAN